MSAAVMKEITAEVRREPANSESYSEAAAYMEASPMTKNTKPNTRPTVPISAW